jgi:hypothetical protein
LILIVLVDVAEEALEVGLMFPTRLVLGLFEGCVADEDLALFAPMARLR